MTTPLEAAIAALASARQRLDKIETLVDDHQRLASRARHKMLDAELALNVSRENESRDAVNALLSDTTVAAKPVSHHETEFENAVAELEKARRLVTNLERERDAAERSVQFAANRHSTALGEALAQHPAVIRLHERRRSLESKLASVHEAIGVVFRAHGTPAGYAQSFIEWQGAFDPALRDSWQKAIEEFATTGQFPEVD